MPRLLHLTNTHTQPIIDLIRRKRARERENIYGRQKEERLEILFSSFVCIEKNAERISILPLTHTPEIILCVRVVLSYIDVRRRRRRRENKDIKPMAHLTIVTKR
jgi:hypothetical protein